MKKQILISALALSAVLLAACGNSNDQQDTLPVITDPVIVAGEAGDEADEQGDTTLLNSQQQELVYGEISELSAVWNHDFSVYTESDKVVSVEDSMAHAFLSRITSESGFYLAGEFSEYGLGNLFIAVQGERLALKASVDGDDIVMMHLDGRTMTMYDPTSMSAMKMEIPEEELGEGSAIDMIIEQFASLADLLDSDPNAKDIYVFEVEIEGETYTYEFQDGAGFVFDSSGQIRKFVHPDGDLNVYIFTPDIPANAFDLPEGYEVMDLTELAGLLAEGIEMPE